jgi:hypothetical protein
MTSTTTEWGTATLPEAGFAPDLEERFECRSPSWGSAKPAWRGGRPQRTHLLRALSSWFGRGSGRPLGAVRFGPNTLHDMRSVTKSIVGLLYGIALATLSVPVPEAKLVEQFLEYPELSTDPAR